MTVRPTNEQAPLTRLRLAQGLTAEALGAKAGVSGNLIHKYDKGYRPDTNHLEVIASVLGVSVEELEAPTTADPLELLAKAFGIPQGEIENLSSPRAQALHDKLAEAAQAVKEASYETKPQFDYQH